MNNEIWFRLWWDDLKHQMWLDHNHYKAIASKYDEEMLVRAHPNGYISKHTPKGWVPDGWYRGWSSVEHKWVINKPKPKKPF